MAAPQHQPRQDQQHETGCAGPGVLRDRGAAGEFEQIDRLRLGGRCHPRSRGPCRGATACRCGRGSRRSRSTDQLVLQLIDELAQQFLRDLLDHAAAELRQFADDLDIAVHRDASLLTGLVQLQGDGGRSVLTSAGLLAAVKACQQRFGQRGVFVAER